jgi:hypothetical protein
VSLGARDMRADPHTVLLTRLAESGKRAREAQARGRGRPRYPDAVTRRFSKSQSAGPIQARGAGIRGLDGLPHAKTQPCAASGPLGAGSSRPWRVRRRAHPLCSLRDTGMAPAQRLWGVSAGTRPSVRVWGRRYSGLGLCQAFSPTWPGRFARAHARVGTAWRLQHRPMCGVRCPSSAQTSPSVCPRLLSHT